VRSFARRLSGEPAVEEVIKPTSPSARCRTAGRGPSKYRMEQAESRLAPTNVSLFDVTSAGDPFTSAMNTLALFH
jgi:hypothetical protein